MSRPINAFTPSNQFSAPAVGQPFGLTPRRLLIITGIALLAVGTVGTALTAGTGLAAVAPYIASTLLGISAIVTALYFMKGPRPNSGAPAPLTLKARETLSVTDEREAKALEGLFDSIQCGLPRIPDSVPGIDNSSYTTLQQKGHLIRRWFSLEATQAHLGTIRRFETNRGVVFHELPPEFYLLKNVENITFRLCSVENIRAEAFKQFSSLKGLLFNDVQLRSIEARAFANCPVLTDFDMRWCSPRVILPTQILADCPELSEVAFHGSSGEPLSLASDALTQCPKLKRIRAIYTEADFPSLFQGHPLLESIYLSGKGVVGLGVDFFGGCQTTVREITLSHIRVTRLPEGVFHGLSKLKSLTLEGYPIPAIEGRAFSGNPELTQIQIGGREDVESPLNLELSLATFEGCPALRSVSFNRNGSGSLPDPALSTLAKRLSGELQRVKEASPDTAPSYEILFEECEEEE